MGTLKWATIKRVNLMRMWELEMTLALSVTHGDRGGCGLAFVDFHLGVIPWYKIAVPI